VLQKYTTHAFPPSPLPPSYPPPPLVPSPLLPHPQLRCWWGETSLALVLWQGCSLKEKGDSSVMTAQLSYLMDQSRGRILPERRSQEMTSSDPAPFPSSLGFPDSGTWRQGEGGGQSLACTWSHIRSISARVLEHTQDLLDVT
jgi:hypothetical protein